MAKIRISAVVNTWNEEKNLADCLRTLEFCDEIVVVDMESTDSTKNIAKQFTDKIYDHKQVGFVEPARNFAIQKAVGDWILIVDADERIPRSLAARLTSIANQGDADFVRIPRKNIIFGQWLRHSRWWPDYNVRFFKKGVVEWQNEIHSIPVTTGTGISLEDEAALAIEHHHYNNIDEYFERSLRYSTQQANELISSGYRFDPADLITKPIGEFLSRFFAGEGYKDGLHGLALAFLQFISIMMIYLKVWQSEGHQPIKSSELTPIWEKEFASKAKEIHYWFLTVQIQSAKSNLIVFILKLKRRFLR